MPLMNTRYVAGPLDEAVYRAAEQAGMPAVVISGFDGEGWVWRWTLSRWDSQELRDVLLRVRPIGPGSFKAEVGVEVSSYAPVPCRSKWRAVDQQSLRHFKVDEAWVAEKLRTARELAARP